MRSLALTLLCALASAPLARADLYIETTTTLAEGEQQQQVVTEAWFTGKAAANRGVDGTMRIIRFDKELIWDVDPKTKTYRETTFAEMRKLQQQRRERAKAQAAQLRGYLKQPGLTAEQREKITRVLAALDGGRYEIVRGGTEQVLDYTARRFDVKVNGKPFMTVWATRDVGNVDEFNQLQALSGASQPDLHDQLRKIEGVWLKWKTADEQRVAVATKIQTTELPASHFQVPAGYTKR